MDNHKPDTKRLRTILEGIRDGKLEHNQKTYHCGTARCVAGWYQVMKLLEVGVSWNTDWNCYANYGLNEDEVDDFQADYALSEPALDILCAFPFEFARNGMNLTEPEANALFMPMATLKDQFEVLENLEKGMRLIDIAGNFVWVTQAECVGEMSYWSS